MATGPYLAAGFHSCCAITIPICLQTAHRRTDILRRLAMDRARHAAAEASNLRETSEPKLVGHMQQKRPHEQGTPMQLVPANSKHVETHPTGPVPKIQPAPTTSLSATKKSGTRSCPLQSLRASMGAHASSMIKRGSCLPIAPAGTQESEQAAHLLASFKQKDDESLRKEKRKMRNRLAAAKSNERRREKLEAQKKELEDLKERLHTLKSKQVVAEKENEKLKSSLRQKGNEGNGTSSSAMSDGSHST